MCLYWWMPNIFLKELYKILLLSAKGIFLLFDLYFHYIVWNIGRHDIQLETVFFKHNYASFSWCSVGAKCSCFQGQYHSEAV